MSEPLWPEDQFFLTQETLSEFHSKCRNAFITRSRELEIKEDLLPLLDALYIPLAAWLGRLRNKQNKALVVGLCGAQGSGKSTLSELLKTVLATGWKQRVVTFSLDDLYKTRAERAKMARAVHPLFATRGVPGTHDVELGIRTIEKLKAQSSKQSTPIPVFDKARDDRKPKEAWPMFRGHVDVIILEGWCVGAMPQPAEALATPINDLEREEDSDGTWRTAVNRALGGEYQSLFALMDILLLLKIDTMSRVFEWRRLQEQKLAKKAATAGSTASELRIMSDPELNRFIMHFERLTRHILAEMPPRADLVFSLAGAHNPARVLINKRII